MDKNIMRVVKNKDNPYVVLNTIFLDDEKSGVSLSLRAKGLLAYILTLPDDWKIYVNELTKHHKDGKDSMCSAINELIEHNYIHREKLRENGKFKGYSYKVFEMPTKPTETNISTVSGKTGNGETRNGFTENGKPATTNYLNKLNNNITNYPSINQENSITKHDGLMDSLFKKYEIDKLSCEDEKYLDVVHIIHDVLNSSSGIRVNGEYKKIDIVKSIFNRLETQHLQYVVEQINNTTDKIRNMRSYIITSLYNSISTINSYYTNEVRTN
jgi:hypothetical protein